MVEYVRPSTGCVSGQEYKTLGHVFGNRGEGCKYGRSACDVLTSGESVSMRRTGGCLRVRERVDGAHGCRWHV